MKIISIVLSIILFSSLFNMAFASEGYFENDYRKELSYEPTVCIFQPNDYRISDDKWDIWYSEMKSAIDTWESVLKQSGSGYWEITVVEVPLNKLELLNYGVCDIKVNFTAIPHPNEPTWLGWYTYGTGNITIMLTKYEYCGTQFIPQYHVYVNKKCFTNDVERPKKVSATLQHEMGHAMGLSHYVSSDRELMQHWIDNPLGLPSIMTFSVDNEELRKITNVDVELLRNIYGHDGFTKKNNQLPVFSDPIIPEPTIEVSKYNSVKLTETSKQIITISGYVPDKLYQRGMYLNLIIQEPDGSSDTKAVSVSKTLHSYKYPLSFDISSQPGKYNIELIFNGETFEKRIIEVFKKPTTSSPTVTEKQHTTNTQSSFTLANTDQDNDGIPDRDDLCDRQGETYNGYQDTDGCPDKNTANTKLDNDVYADVFNERMRSLFTQIDFMNLKLKEYDEHLDQNFESQEANNFLNKAQEQFDKMNQQVKDAESGTLDLEKNKQFIINNPQHYNSVFDNMETKISSAENNLKYIDQELQHAKNAELKYLQEKQPLTDIDRQCFFFWCW